MDNINKTSEEAFSEEIKRLLESPEYLEKKPSLDQFKVMVYKERERKRKKRMAAVASIAVVLIAGFFAFETIAPEVESDLTPMEEKVTEEGVIIENRGWGSYVEERDKVVITDWEAVGKARKNYSQLVIPDYVPKGYIFKKAAIEEMENDGLISNYIFTNDKNELLEIEVINAPKGATAVEIENGRKGVKTKKGIIYLQKEERIATIMLDDGYIVNVWYNVSKQELIKIIEAIE